MMGLLCFLAHQFFQFEEDSPSDSTAVCGKPSQNECRNDSGKFRIFFEKPPVNSGIFSALRPL